MAYHQRILDSIPESFQGFAPERPDPVFKFEANPDTENSAVCMMSAKIMNAIKQKCTQEEIQAVLKEIPDDENDQNMILRVNNFNAILTQPEKNLLSNLKVNVELCEL